MYNQYIVIHLKSKKAAASRADITALKDGVLRALWIKNDRHIVKKIVRYSHQYAYCLGEANWITHVLVCLLVLGFIKFYFKKQPS